MQASKERHGRLRGARGAAVAGLVLALGGLAGGAASAFAAEGAESVPATGAPESAPHKPSMLPPTLRPLPPLGDRVGGDSSKIIDEFKLGKGLAKPKLQFLELHGYFRWRSDYFYNLDLRK